MKHFGRELEGGWRKSQIMHLALAAFLCHSTAALSKTEALRRHQNDSVLPKLVRCKMVAPAEWKDSIWDGGCHEGKPNGLGVLKMQAGNPAAGIFYGRALDGRPVIGVIEYPDGYKPGTFRNDGKMVVASNRKAADAAFNAAITAAYVTSLEMKFYREESASKEYLQAHNRLKAQLD